MLCKEARYPHLLPVDGEIWHTHNAAHCDQYSQLEYDVRVGDGRDPGPDFPENMRAMALALSCRRIDVVGTRGNTLDIIEVTHSAGLKAIGQLIAYPILYRQTYPTTMILNPVLVAGEIQTDVLPILDRLHIQYYVYPLSERLPAPRSQPKSAQLPESLPFRTPPSPDTPSV